jgi:hypothetical protein
MVAIPATDDGEVDVNTHRIIRLGILTAVPAVAFLSILLTAGVVVALPIWSAAATGDGSTRLVSTDSSGAQGNGYSRSPFLSSDGRYVAYSSYASNLVAGDTNGVEDIFVKDTVTGATRRVSTDSSGAEGNSDSGLYPSISSDGRYVAFYSYASNLVAGDTNGMSDIFVKDTVTGATRRVSTDSSGAEGYSDSDGSPLISADGRYVAFSSPASNLVAGDTNGAWDVFVKDTLTGSTRRVSTDSSGAEGNDTSRYPCISSDGRYVAFESVASNLVADDTNGASDIFVKDTLTGATRRVSTDSSGAEGNSTSWEKSISSDGRYVAFGSYAPNLVAGDTNGDADVFVKDTLTGSTRIVTTDSFGAPSNGFSSGYASISSSGRYVAFQSWASNLVLDDTNGACDIFVKDTVTGATRRVSISSSGAEGEGDSREKSISSDGRFVAFRSAATNLVASDTNGTDDIFVRDLGPMSGVLSGTVTSAGGVLAGVTVSVPTHLPVSTASNGTYMLDGIVPGIQNVTFSKSGYVSQTRTVTIRAGDVTTQDVSLIRVPQATTTKLLGPTSVKVKLLLKLTGTVSPRPGVGTVLITKTRLSGRRWVHAGSVRVGVVKSTGRFAYSFRPTVKGSWRFVATYSGGKVGTTTYKTSKSAVKGVRVR